MPGFEFHWATVDRPEFPGRQWPPHVTRGGGKDERSPGERVTGSRTMIFRALPVTDQTLRAAHPHRSSLIHRYMRYSPDREACDLVESLSIETVQPVGRS